jgi:hypothetical protein
MNLGPAGGFSMHEPFYVRPADYHYTLVSDPAYGWWTGAIHRGRQLLRGVSAVLLFDEDGDLERIEKVEGYPIPQEWRQVPPVESHAGIGWPRALAFEEGPIRIKRFWLPELWLGIEDLPDGLAEYYTSPETFESEPEDVQWWIEAGQYVFHAGCGDYYMSPEGRVETS